MILRTMRQNNKKNRMHEMTYVCKFGKHLTSSDNPAGSSLNFDKSTSTRLVHICRYRSELTVTALQPARLMVRKEACDVSTSRLIDASVTRIQPENTALRSWIWEETADNSCNNDDDVDDADDDADDDDDDDDDDVDVEEEERETEASALKTSREPATTCWCCCCFKSSTSFCCWLCFCKCSGCSDSIARTPTSVTRLQSVISIACNVCNAAIDTSTSSVTRQHSAKEIPFTGCGWHSNASP